MADTFPNPYRYTSPIGDALANLTRAMLSGKSEAERIKSAEEALKLKNVRESTGRVADVFRLYGKPGFDRNSAMADAVIAGYDPADLGELERYGAANLYGAADPRTANAQVGAGGAYSSTAPAFFTDQAGQNKRAADILAENARQFNEKPHNVLVDGIPTIGTQAGAIGLSPVLSETDRKGTLLGNNWSNLGELDPLQKRILGATGGEGSTTPRNYVAPNGSKHITYDGITDAQTGAPLPPGGYIATAQGTADEMGLRPNVEAGLQNKDINADIVKGQIDFARDLIMRSPDTNFGAAGMTKGLVQNASILAANLATGLGFHAPADALAAIQAKAAQAGVDQSIISGIFDPRLSEMDTTYGLLVYSIASALAGQSGRDLSNVDVSRAMATVGSPTSFFSNKQTMLTKLDTIEKLLGIQQSVVDERLGNPPALGGTVADGEPPASFMPNDPTRGEVWKHVRPEDRALFQ